MTENEERRTLWERIFGEPQPPPRLMRVLDYVIGRVQQGAPLEEIAAEEYVRRNASPDELERIFGERVVVEAARLSMRTELGNRPPTGASWEVGGPRSA